MTKKEKRGNRNVMNEDRERRRKQEKRSGRERKGRRYVHV